jgi:hypothetical protein
MPVQKEMRENAHIYLIERYAGSFLGIEKHKTVKQNKK